MRSVSIFVSFAVSTVTRPCSISPLVKVLLEFTASYVTEIFLIVCDILSVCVTTAGVTQSTPFGCLHTRACLPVGSCFNQQTHPHLLGVVTVDWVTLQSLVEAKDYQRGVSLYAR